MDSRPKDSLGRAAADYLNHLPWLRRFARRLAKDPHLADDLLQEVWFELSRRGPTTSGAVRAWLAGILHNRWRQHRRSTRRRLTHERRAAVPDEIAPADRDGAIATVLEGLVALDEPYRTVLTLRFLHGWSVKEIGGCLERPTRTVHAQVERGLEQLRRRCGAAPRRRGLAWWLVLRRPRVWAVGAAGAVGIAVTASGWLATSQRVAVPRQRAAGDAVATAALPEAEPAALPRQAVGTVAVGAPARVWHCGQVVDRRGRGVPGAIVWADGGAVVAQPGARPRFRDGPQMAHTVADANGRFVLAVATGAKGCLRARAPGRAAILGSLFDRAAADHVIVLAETGALRGKVQTRSGTPVQGASIRWKMPESDWDDFLVALPRALLLEPQTTSAIDGGFSLPRTPRIAGATLSCDQPGFAASETAAPAPAWWGMRPVAIELEPLVAPGVRGRVIDDRGEPVVGAAVGRWPQLEHTDADGRFRLAADRRGRDTSIVAAIAGKRPTICRVEPSPNGEVVLRLAATSLGLQGTVRAATGSGLAGALVWVADPTPLGIDARPWFAEPLARGDDRPWVGCRTDARGAFAIRGLAARRYSLRALLPDTGRVVELGAFVAGTEVDAAVASPAAASIVRGVVVDRDGTRLAGAEIRAEACLVSAVDTGGDVELPPVRLWHVLRRTNADRHGGFDLGRLAPGVRLRAEYSGFMPSFVDVRAGVPATTTLCLARRVEVRIARPRAEPVWDAVAFEDAHGTRLAIEPRLTRDPGVRVRRAFERQVHAAAEPEILVVPDTAAELLLLEHGAMVRRIPVRLQAGRINELSIQ
ncbi:MAG: sigma-70 family RNA polymerase sigma factor [Planctomycetota bacterium]